MSDIKLSELTELTTVADDDYLYVADTSESASRKAQAKNVRGWPITAAETSAGVTPTNYQYSPGDVLRYGTNTTPGTTDMSTAIQNALDVANTAGGGVVTVPSGVYLCNSGLTVYGGTILRGSGSGQLFNPAATHTGSIIKAGASIAALVTTDENSSSGGHAVVENILLDGDDVATATVVMSGIKDTLRDCKVINGGTYGVHQNLSNVGEQVLENVTITMNSTGTGLYVQSGSDNNYINLIVHGAYTGAVLESGGHQFTNFHPYPSPLDPGDASHVCLLDIGATGDNYFVNCHFDQVHTSGQFQVRISTDNVIAASSPGSALENVFVGCSFDNPNADIDDVVSGVYMDASADGTSRITASFIGCFFSGNGTYKYQYAFEKEATNPTQIHYHVVGGWANNVNTLWSHDPDSMWGFQHLSGGYVEVSGVSAITDNLTVKDDLTVTDDLTVSGKILTPDGGELTISSGAVTVTGNYHTVDTEADDATDNLNNINGGSAGMMLLLTAEDSARDVVVKDGTGNIQTAGDFTLDNAQDTILLFYTGSVWKEVSRSDNGA